VGGYRATASSTTSPTIYQCVEYERRLVGSERRQQELRRGHRIGPAAAAVIPSSVKVVVMGAWWAIGRAHEQNSRFDLTIDLEKKAPD
jgi:hypothetical protein